MKNYYLATKIGILILSIFLFGCRDNNEQSEKLSDIAPISVKTAELREMTFYHKILVQGNIQAIDDAIISAKVAGTIEELNVTEGSKVKKGEVLFQTDRKNLENQVLIAEQNLNVAKENCKTIEQDIQIAETNLNKANSDYERAKKLVKNKVISQTAFEETEADYLRKQAVLTKEKTVLDYNLVRVTQAETNLHIAQKNLADSVIIAPFDGVITNKFHEPGEYVNVGAQVLMIENTSVTEVVARISSVYYEMINFDTELIVFVDGKELCRTRVTFISPTIDQLSRTFKIKAVLPENSDVICGSLCDIEIILAQRNGFGINSNAVLARAGGKSSVFLVKDDKAEEIFVDIGFTTNGYTEILNSKEIGKAPIVISGQYFLNNGDKVKVID